MALLLIRILVLQIISVGLLYGGRSGKPSPADSPAGESSPKRNFFSPLLRAFSRSPASSPAQTPGHTPADTPSRSPAWRTPAQTPSRSQWGTPAQTPSRSPHAQTPSRSQWGTPAQTPSRSPHAQTPSRSQWGTPAQTPSRSPHAQTPSRSQWGTSAQTPAHNPGRSRGPAAADHVTGGPNQRSRLKLSGYFARLCSNGFEKEATYDNNAFPPPTPPQTLPVQRNQADDKIVACPPQRQRTRKSNREKPYDGPQWGQIKGNIAVYTIQGERPATEDTYSIRISDPLIGIGLFDGHGGKEVAETAADSLLQIILRAIEKSPGPTSKRKIIGNIFKDFDRQFDKTNLRRVGSTALVGVIYGRDLYIANLGDSRAIAKPTGSNIARQITTDHKPIQIDENKRIQTCGKLIIDKDGVWRVCNPDKSRCLSTSRAFGDFDLKEFGVIAEPDMTRIVLSPDKEPLDFLVFATDGLWDVMENQEVIDFIGKYLEDSDSYFGAKPLALAAWEKGSSDNISVMVLKLGLVPRSMQKSASESENEDKQSDEDRREQKGKLMASAATKPPRRPTAPYDRSGTSKQAGMNYHN